MKITVEPPTRDDHLPESETFHRALGFTITESGALEIRNPKGHHIAYAPGEWFNPTWGKRFDNSEPPSTLTLCSR